MRTSCQHLLTFLQYQIYGHSLGDLILHTAYYNPEKRSMTLGMDS